MKKYFLFAAVGLAALAVATPQALAWCCPFLCCCQKEPCYIGCPPYNAFSPPGCCCYGCCCPPPPPCFTPCAPPICCEPPSCCSSGCCDVGCLPAPGAVGSAAPAAPVPPAHGPDFTPPPPTPLPAMSQLMGPMTAGQVQTVGYRGYYPYPGYYNHGGYPGYAQNHGGYPGYAGYQGYPQNYQGYNPWMAQQYYNPYAAFGYGMPQGWAQ